MNHARTALLAAPLLGLLACQNSLPQEARDSPAVAANAPDSRRGMVGTESSDIQARTGNGSLMSAGLTQTAGQDNAAYNRPIGGGPTPRLDAVQNQNEDNEPRSLDPNWHIGTDISSGRRAPRVVIDPTTGREATYRLSPPTPR